MTRPLICCPKCGSYARPTELTYVCSGEFGQCGWWIKFEDWDNYELGPNDFVFYHPEEHEVVSGAA